MTQAHGTTRTILRAFGLVAALLLAWGAGGCASDEGGSADRSGFGGLPSGGPQPEPPGDGMTGGQFGNPNVQGPGLEPPGAPPAGAAGAGGQEMGDGGDAPVQDPVEGLPPGIDSARRAPGTEAEAIGPEDQGTALRNPLPDGGLPDGWDEAFGDEGDDADAGI